MRQTAPDPDASAPAPASSSDEGPPGTAETALDPQVPAEELPSVDVYTRAFADLKPTADALPAERVRPVAVEPDLAYVNAKHGYAAIEPHLDEVRAIPGVDLAAIERVPLAALALLGATHLLGLLLAPKSGLPAKLFRARKLRKILLHVTQAAAGLDLIPDALVDRIVKGTGALDTVRDLIDLCLLLRQYAPALHGQLDLNPALLAEAAELGAELRDLLEPRSAPAQHKATPTEIHQASDDRNRAWTLLLEGYVELQRVATFLGVAVPSLQSRRPLKKQAPAVPPNDAQPA